MENQPAGLMVFFRTLPPQKKIFLIGAGVFIIIAYIVLNVSLWQIARSSQNAAQIVTEGGGVEMAGKENTIVQPMGPTSTPRPTPTPTPRPTGPGPYACSLVGSCKLYDDEVRKAKCTVTYADDLCLDQCADPTKQCKN